MTVAVAPIKLTHSDTLEVFLAPNVHPRKILGMLTVLASVLLLFWWQFFHSFPEIYGPFLMTLLIKLMPPHLL